MLYFDHFLGSVFSGTSDHRHLGLNREPFLDSMFIVQVLGELQVGSLLDLLLSSCSYKQFHLGFSFYSCFSPPLTCTRNGNVIFLTTAVLLHTDNSIVSDALHAYDNTVLSHSYRIQIRGQ